VGTCTLAGGLALLGPAAEPSSGPVDIVVREGRIAAIRPAGAAHAEGEAIDCRNRLVAPGLINGHHHSHEHYFKGRHENLPLELWMNNVRPLEPIPYTRRQVYLRTLIGAIGALRGGATTLVDDLNVSPSLNVEHVEAAFEAYADAGLRALVGITLFDRPFFRGMPFVDEMFPKALLAELDALPRTDPAELLAFAEHLAATRHPRRNRVGYIAAPSAPQRCTEGFLAAVRDLADRHALPVIIHVQETRLQVVAGHALYGATMAEHLARIGFLRPMTSLIHGVWLTPREIEAIAASGATIQHNPISNLKLGSGIAPVRRMLDAGINVSLGTDGCGSIENNNMLQVLAAAALVNKLRGDDPGAWIGAAEAFRAGTVGGAAALGFEGALGEITEGAIADLATYRLDRIPFVPLNDPRGQLVYNEDGASLETILVEGEVVMREGRLTRVDEAALFSEIAEEHRVLLPLIERAERQAARITDAYRPIIARCNSAPISPDTYDAKLRF
jgi:5-methylthioadenosine/S-adenosylhomocysteine deaminase